MNDQTIHDFGIIINSSMPINDLETGYYNTIRELYYRMNFNNDKNKGENSFSKMLYLS